MSGQIYAECRHCTYKLVQIGYRQTRWFRLFRGPMVCGMRLFSRYHLVDVSPYVMRTPACNGCIRFYKSALFEKSASFRWLHGRINPVFNFLIRKIVTEEERRQASDYALRATAGSVTPAEAADWMKGLKHSL